MCYVRQAVEDEAQGARALVEREGLTLGLSLPEGPKPCPTSSTCSCRKRQTNARSREIHVQELRARGRASRTVRGDAALPSPPSTPIRATGSRA